MEEMHNAEYRPVPKELVEQFLSGKNVFTEAQKEKIRYQIDVANNAGIWEYKIPYAGPSSTKDKPQNDYVLVRNGEIVGVDQFGSKFDKESTAKTLE